MTKSDAEEGLLQGRSYKIHQIFRDYNHAIHSHQVYIKYQHKYGCNYFCFKISSVIILPIQKVSLFKFGKGN